MKTETKVFTIIGLFFFIVTAGLVINLSHTEIVTIKSNSMSDCFEKVSSNLFVNERVAYYHCANYYEFEAKKAALQKEEKE